MQLYLTEELGRWLDRTVALAEAGDELADTRLDYVNAAMDLLEELSEAPTPATETAQIKRVRQRGRYELWRTSHPFHLGVAVRLICWFPPGRDTVVLALFAGDKGSIGDVWYSSVASRADPAIDSWRRQFMDQVEAEINEHEGEEDD